MHNSAAIPQWMVLSRPIRGRRLSTMLTRVAVSLLIIVMLILVSPSSNAQQREMKIGEAVQYITSGISSYERGQLRLADGSVWRTNITQFGFTGTTVLISGKNLKTGGGTLYLNGFTFTANHLEGELRPENGFKLRLVAVAADGKRLSLSDNLLAQVLDTDRLFSRNWGSNKDIILSSDQRSIWYLPNLQRVSVQVSQTNRISSSNADNSQ